MTSDRVVGRRDSSEWASRSPQPSASGVVSGHGYGNGLSRTSTKPVNSRVRAVHSATHTSTDTKTRSLRYGKDWWIFCASIEPADGGWDAWRQTLDDEYNHVSEIGQPAKFAQALAGMVADQVGPQGKDGWLRQTTKGAESERTRHPLQWVIHGPVVYTDQVYQDLTDQSDGMAHLAASIFTKGARYAGQREYRFAVLGSENDAETIALRISGMMRDSLERIGGGLVRVPPPPKATGGDGVETAPQSEEDAAVRPTIRKTASTRRVTEREERRWDIRASDGQVLSSDAEQRERSLETVVTEDYEPDRADSQSGGLPKRAGTTGDQRGSDILPAAAEHDSDSSDDEAVREIAAEEREWADRTSGGETSIPVVHRGSGRTYRSFEDMFKDPAAPLSPAAKTWQEAASTAEEISKTYGAVEILNLKMAEIREEHRQDTASAGWYAIHCIRNIYARFGDIVESVWIERERFVVIRLNDSAGAGATGRVVVSPTGAYAYCLQLPGREVSGGGGREWGTQFFPMGSEIESFEEFGWPAKLRKEP